jgi:hypothetical protein
MSIQKIARFVVCLTAAFTTRSLALSSSDSGGSSRPRIHTIQVCQSKDCCQRFTGRACDLVQTLRQITYNTNEVVTMESTGCLSHCDKGPNVRILLQTKRGTTTTTNEEILQHGINSAAAAAAVLELVSGTDGLKIHPTLLAAWKVMEQAHQGRHGDIACYSWIASTSIYTDSMVFVITNIWLHFIESPVRLCLQYRHRCYLKPTVIVKGRVMVERRALR